MQSALKPGLEADRHADPEAGGRDRNLDVVARLRDARPRPGGLGRLQRVSRSRWASSGSGCRAAGTGRRRRRANTISSGSTASWTTRLRSASRCAWRPPTTTGSTNRRGAPGRADSLPEGEETLAAWDRWVEAMVRRYAPKGVKEWMMYNEPNLNKEQHAREDRRQQHPHGGDHQAGRSGARRSARSCSPA